MKGLNTEVDPRKLGALKEAFAQFTNVTLAGGYVHPVRGDGTHATQTFAETNLGTLSVSSPLSISGTSGFQAYCALAGGAVVLRSGSGATQALAWAAPAAPTVASYALSGVGGLGTAGTRQYAAALVGSWGYHTGLGSVATVGPLYAHVLFFGSTSGADPAVGDTLACGSALATVGGVDWGAHSDAYTLTYGLDGTWASGDTVTWGTNGTGTLGYAAVPVNDLWYVTLDRNTLGTTYPGTVGATFTGPSGTGTACLWHNETTDKHVFLTNVSGSFSKGEFGTWASGANGKISGAAEQFMSPALLPAGTRSSESGWNLYGLDDGGSWRQVGAGGIYTYATSGTWYFDTVQDSTPDISTLTPYDGPLDPNGLPETLIVPGTCQVVALHKGSLLVGEGNLLRWSEGAITGIEYRWFRDGYAMDCGGTVWAIVSRGEIAEIWTSAGVKYLVGSTPYFELRDYQLREPAISRYSIHAIDAGTFYHASDGLRLLAGGASKLLSNDWNTPWFDAITNPTTTVGGGSQDKYFLCDSTGRCITFRWSDQEWGERTFTSQPVGFLWSPTGCYVVAKVGAAYLSLEAGAGAVSWQIQYPTRSGGRNRPLPSYFFLNNVGDLTADVYVEDVLVRSIPVVGGRKGRIRLPQARGIDWYLVLRGSGTPTSNKIWSVE